ncbi:hypothetical protein FJY63_11070 [Candidatus Sumerlaeota bacterium]|nr:hypothetical protein [Candidatus Sumerlaeota bacterium]
MSHHNEHSSRALRWANVIPAITIALAVLMLASIAAAQSLTDVVPLTARERLRLSRQAREAYDNALLALDHIDLVSAIQILDHAAQLDPESIELQFLTARFAYLRGRVLYRDEALKYYGIAEKALQRVAQRKELPILTKDRLKREMNVVANEKKNLEVRDARRMAVGEEFRKLYASERYGAQGEGQTAAGGVATDRGRIFTTGEAGGPGQSPTGGGQTAAGEPSIRVTDLSSARSGGGSMMGPGGAGMMGPGGMPPMGMGVMGGGGRGGGGRRR